MGLLNYLKNRKKVELLNQKERAFLVKVVLIEQEVIPPDADTTNFDFKQTPFVSMYVLVKFIDLLYTFIMNKAPLFQGGASTGRRTYDDANESLEPGIEVASLRQLAEFTVQDMDFSDMELEVIRDVWDNRIDKTEEKTLNTLSAVLYWYDTNIIQTIQMAKCLQDLKSNNITEIDDDTLEMIDYNKSLNRPLIDSYLDMRKSVV